jgi:ABC-type Zn uptake system ZnuABC Zn-binding protein ZnuA
MTMFDFHFKRPARLAFGVVVAAAALTLAACHSSDNNDGGGATPPVVVTPTEPVGDTFIAAVKAVVKLTNETAEPGPIDAIAVTAPETAAPEDTN